MPPPARRTCIDWSDLKVGASLPRLSEQAGATLSSEGDLEVRDVGGRRGVGLSWGTAPDGTPQPGILFIALPEPAAEVTMAVEVPGFDWVALRAWSGTEQVAVDLGVPGTETLRVAAESIDAVTLGWGFNVEPALFQVCWTTRADADAQDAWSAAQDALETAAERWSSDEPILEPDSQYLLEVTTRALLTKGGDEVQRTEERHAVQFQTGGPPGIVPSWVPAAPPPEPNTSVGFPHGGVLGSLAPYVRRSIPDPGARPVFRAYDLGLRVRRLVRPADVRRRPADPRARRRRTDGGGRRRRRDRLRQRVGGGAGHDAHDERVRVAHTPGRVHRGGRVGRAGRRRRGAERGARPRSTTTSRARSSPRSRRTCSIRRRRGRPAGTSTAACCARTS